MKSWAGLAVLALGTAPAAADGPASPTPPALAIGVPPGSGPVAGFDRDLYAEAARDAGVTVAWVEVADGAALRGLDAGRFDVAAGPFPLPEGARPGRRALPPVGTAGDALLKRRGDGAVLKPADAADKVLGLLPGPPEPAGPRDALARLRARPAARRGFDDRLSDPVAGLLAGRLAAVAGPLDGVAAAALARPGALEVVGPPFGATARLAPVMRAGTDPAPLAAALGRMRADGRLAALQRKWFGLVLDPPDPTPAAPPPQPQPVSTSKP